jgi:hypothetical protein
MDIIERKVDGQSVYYVDNLVPKEEVDKFSRIAEKLSFTKTEISHERDEYLSFKVNFKTENFHEKVKMGRISEDLIRQLYPAKQYRLYRAYLNMTNFGDVEYPHTDCARDEEDITILYYAHGNWDKSWGGETYFYSRDEVELAISPKAGRFLIFPGAVEHVGTVPTRICKTSRFSLVMKYKLDREN